MEVLYNLSQNAQRIAEEKLKDEMDLSDAPEEYRGKNKIYMNKTFCLIFSLYHQIH